MCWRTYWKGWLEQRPQVWTTYVTDITEARDQLSTDDSFAAEVAAAERGDTGIACFDAWVEELTQTGYLHNHARMWFASIWIFTLKLPWQLGADFFYRHLLDGDPASNTLSWRWVAGLHTRGKSYLARADNIAAYTVGRFTPSRDELAANACALEDDRVYPRVPLMQSDPLRARERVVLLVTEDNLSPETWALGTCEIVAVALFKTCELWSCPFADRACFQDECDGGRRRAMCCALEKVGDGGDDACRTCSGGDGKFSGRCGDGARACGLSAGRTRRLDRR